MKTINTGIKKLVCNNVTIEFYQFVITGVRKYHNTVLSDVEVNICKLTPLLKITLNKNNISDAQDALLETFESNDAGNPFAEL